MRQEIDNDICGILITVMWCRYANKLYPVEFNTLMCCILMVSFSVPFLFNSDLASVFSGIISSSLCKACNTLIIFCLSS